MLDGHKSLKNIFFPSNIVKGVFSKSMFTVPAIAYIITNGGEAKKLDLINGWILPSKFLLPEITLQTFKSPDSINSETFFDKGPELPIHVVQPYPTISKPKELSGLIRFASSKYFSTTLLPGAKDVFYPPRNFYT